MIAVGQVWALNTNGERWRIEQDRGNGEYLVRALDGPHKGKTDAVFGAEIRSGATLEQTSAPALDLEALTLAHGSHDTPEHGMCVMEAVAYVAGEPFSDHPECASPVIGAFLRSWNDSLDDTDRQILKPLIPKLVGTRGTVEQEQERAWLATDWLVRECAPAFLRLAGLTGQAEKLEQLAALTGREAAIAAQPTLDGARKDAAAAWAAARDAAWDAAGDAAWDAAWDAARAAAWDAARDAARDAAWDAAGDAARAAARAAAWDAAGAAARAAAWDAAGAAAWDAAWDAAGDAAWDALEPTVKTLQASALLLVDRMIAVTSGPISEGDE